MVVNPDKIKAVIKHWGNIKGIPEKSHLTRFAEEYDLNYKQWAAFCNGGQTAGYKVVDVFMDIFPSMDMNYLIKEEIPANADMFDLSTSKFLILQEPNENYKSISNNQLYLKLEEIHFEIKSVLAKK